MRDNKKIIIYSDKEIERKQVLIAINTALRDSRDFLRKSIKSVVWIKEVDLTGDTLDYTRNFVKLCIDWVKRHNKDLDITAFYVVDRALLDSLSTQMYGFSDMWRIEEVVREKAVDDGEKFLEEVKDMYGREGIEITTRIKFGNPIREINRESRALNAYTILAGDNKLTKEIKASCPVVILAPRHEKRLPTKIKRGLSARVKNLDTYLTELR